MPDDWLKVLEDLLTASIQEPPGDPGRVLRIMKHGFVRTEYWLVGPRWRFIIVPADGSRTLVTVEWVFFGRKTLKRLRKAAC